MPGTSLISECMGFNISVTHCYSIHVCICRHLDLICFYNLLFPLEHKRSRHQRTGGSHRTSAWEPREEIKENRSLESSRPSPVSHNRSGLICCIFTFVVHSVANLSFGLKTWNIASILLDLTSANKYIDTIYLHCISFSALDLFEEERVRGSKGKENHDVNQENVVTRRPPSGKTKPTRCV